MEGLHKTGVGSLTQRKIAFVCYFGGIVLKLGGYVQYFGVLVRFVLLYGMFLVPRDVFDGK